MKKYKPVAKKVKLLVTELSEHFRIVHNIISNPLENLPILPTRPSNFEPCGCYTFEHMQLIDKAHPKGFLLPKEQKLMHNFMMLHQDSFAWNNSECGHFQEDFSPPIEMPTVPHKPWIIKNFPIPPGIYKEVCRVLQKKIDTSVFEPSNLSYQTCWFCVVKKDRSSLQIVQSLDP